MTAEDAMALSCVPGCSSKAQSVRKAMALCGHGFDQERVWLARFDRLAGIGYVDPKHWELEATGRLQLELFVPTLESILLACKRALQ